MNSRTVCPPRSSANKTSTSGSRSESAASILVWMLLICPPFGNKKSGRAPTFGPARRTHDPAVQAVGGGQRDAAQHRCPRGRRRPPGAQPAAPAEPLGELATQRAALLGGGRIGTPGVTAQAHGGDVGGGRGCMPAVALLERAQGDPGLRRAPGEA